MPGTRDTNSEMWISFFLNRQQDNFKSIKSKTISTLAFPQIRLFYRLSWLLDYHGTKRHLLRTTK